MRNVPSSSPAKGDFEKYYLKHVAMGEGCNCAESVVRDVQGLSKPTVSLKMLLTVLWARLCSRSSAINSDLAQSDGWHLLVLPVDHGAARAHSRAASVLPLILIPVS